MVEDWTLTVKVADAPVAVCQGDLAGADFFQADSLGGGGDYSHRRIAGGGFHDFFIAAFSDSATSIKYQISLI